MSTTQMKRERLSIDVTSQERRMIKAYAALHSQTVKDYVINSIKEQMRREKEAQDMVELTMNLGADKVLAEVWDNQKDSAYDAL